MIRLQKSMASSVSLSLSLGVSDVAEQARGGEIGTRRVRDDEVEGFRLCDELEQVTLEVERAGILGVEKVTAPSVVAARPESLAHTSAVLASNEHAHGYLQKKKRPLAGPLGCQKSLLPEPSGSGGNIGVSSSSCSNSRPVSTS